jgi:hypothetical protein
MGELTIPGFSSYIHPYDDQYLITIGPEGNQSGTGTGNNVQLQLIDVSDLTNPTVVHKHTPDTKGYSWSMAQYDHKAFMYYPNANILALPMMIWSRDANETFSGITAYKVTPENGFSELARIDHADMAKQIYCDSELSPSNSGLYCQDNGYVYWTFPNRTIVMQKDGIVHLYTMSNIGLKALTLPDYSTSWNIVFPPGSNIGWYSSTSTTDG